MGKIISVIAGDGSAVCHLIDSSDMVSALEQIHKTSAVVTAALGRLMTAASLMGSQMKGERDSITLRVKGDGPAGSLIAVSDSNGNPRAYVENPIVEIPLNKHGKLDVSGAVGREGTLYVMRDIGLKEPYIGHTPIISGEIAEDITHYYAVSEQIPTVCALGVLVNPDLSVNCAGGFLAHLLPGAPEDAADRLESNLVKVSAITELLSNGNSLMDIANLVMDNFAPSLIGEYETIYRCDCSRERVERALISLGRDELLNMAKTQPVTEVDCHFCSKKYRFGPDELRALAK